MTVIDESVTTTAGGSASGASVYPSERINSDSIFVTLNGTEYELPKVVTPITTSYGGFDSNGEPIFTEYPCALLVFDSYSYFAVPTDGTYQVKIERADIAVETTPCFKRAVQNALPPSESDVFTVGIRFVANEYEADKTYGEVLDALQNGKLVYANQNGGSAWNFAGTSYTPSEHIYFTKIDVQLNSNSSIDRADLNVLCYYADGSIEVFLQTLYLRS